MQVVKGFENIEDCPKNCVATIGNFDGVHLGHQSIFTKLKAKAKEIQGKATVITFRPHPIMLLRPELKPRLLNSFEEKLELLERVGIDFVVEQPFSREFSNTSPEDFFHKYLLQKLQLKYLYLGHDFVFGKDRQGSVEVLQKLGAQHSIVVEQLSAFQMHEEAISSSKIRALLEQNAIEKVNAYLGREFFVRGLVVKGHGRGRKLGFPTINLQMDRRQLPGLGVYVSKVIWKDQEFPSVTNVGVNPTFATDKDQNQAVVETHILDFQEKVYGEKVEVRFCYFLREEQKFSGPEALSAQIAKDIQAARSFSR